MRSLNRLAQSNLEFIWDVPYFLSMPPHFGRRRAVVDAVADRPEHRLLLVAEQSSPVTALQVYTAPRDSVPRYLSADPNLLVGPPVWPEHNVLPIVSVVPDVAAMVIDAGQRDAMSLVPAHAEEPTGSLLWDRPFWIAGIIAVMLDYKSFLAPG